MFRNMSHVRFSTPTVSLYACVLVVVLLTLCKAASKLGAMEAM